MAELLYKLKEWLTVPDAAAHLSIAFGENVTEADVLRLGLDRHLTLSVNFVNGATGRLGKVVPEEQAPVRTLERFVTPDGKPVGMVGDIHFSEDGEALVFDHRDETKLDSIFGIWDLPMRGSERLDVEHRHQGLTGGPGVTLVNIGGTFVNRPDGAWCELREQVELRVSGPGGVERAPVPGEKDPTGSTAVIRTARDGFRGHRRERSWIPAGALPADAVLVVRTAVLDELKRRIPTLLHNEPRSLKTTEPMETRSEQAESAGRTQMVGGSRLASWLATELEERDMTVNRLHKLADLDRKTIKKVLDGKSVRQSHLRKLASGLSHEGRQVSASDIPTD